METKQDELDVREIFFALLKKWKQILIITMIVGVLGFVAISVIPQKYIATSSVSVNTSAISTVGISPVNVLKSDEIKEIIDGMFNEEILDKVEVSFSPAQNSEDQTIVIIQVSADTPLTAKQVADAWADISVQWVVDRVYILRQDFETATTNIEQADLALADFLKANNLEYLSWAELVLISGSGDEGNLLFNQNGVVLPKLTTEQRVELSRLLRDKNVLEWDYSNRAMRYVSYSVDVENETFVLYYSDSVADIEKNSGIGTATAISFSLFVGFLFSIVWVLVLMWWKNTPKSTGAD